MDSNSQKHAPGTHRPDSVRSRYFCRLAFIDSRWMRDQLIEVDDCGVIVSRRGPIECPTGAVTLDGPCLPGIPNVHSHAFQRAMVGMTEMRTSQGDSFWTWREQMYRLAQNLSSRQIYTIAKMLYLEMLRGGYTSVGEFQYLHHDLEGRPYPHAEHLSELLIQAAVDVGLPICILPVLYQRAGFDNAQLLKRQRRFYCQDTTFLQLVENLQKKWAAVSGVTVGVAYHSLRAVQAEKIEQLNYSLRNIIPDGPFHIHVAEQQQEVDDCLAATGQRPVEHLLSNVEIDQRWCLIHATHLIEAERIALANSGCIVGLCPQTEANLGDGLFPTAQYLEEGGAIAIGSDSQICVNPASEMRLLEYQARLELQQRAILVTDDKSCGQTLFEATVTGGSQALAQNCGQVSVGRRLDLIELDPDHPAVFDASLDHAIDKWLFFESQIAVRRVIAAGKIVLHQGRHADQDQIEGEYRTFLRSWGRQNEQ